MVLLDLQALEYAKPARRGSEKAVSTPSLVLCQSAASVLLCLP